jgi:hypothetical protein
MAIKPRAEFLRRSYRSRNHATCAILPAMRLNKEQKISEAILRAVDVLKQHAPPEGLKDTQATEEYYAIFKGSARWRAHAAGQLPGEGLGTATLTRPPMRQR